MIGVAANSKESVLELLREVEEIEKQEREKKREKKQEQEQSESNRTLSLIYVTNNWKKRDKESKIFYALAKKDSKVKIDQKGATVVGAKFSNWKYVKKWKNFSNCKMMIIDDGSKMYVPDALLPLGYLLSTRCKLIVAGDINVSAL